MQLLLCAILSTDGLNGGSLGLVRSCGAVLGTTAQEWPEGHSCVSGSSAVLDGSTFKWST